MRGAAAFHAAGVRDIVSRLRVLAAVAAVAEGPTPAAVAAAAAVTVASAVAVAILIFALPRAILGWNQNACRCVIRDGRISACRHREKISEAPVAIGAADTGSARTDRVSRVGVDAASPAGAARALQRT